MIRMNDDDDEKFNQHCENIVHPQWRRSTKYSQHYGCRKPDAKVSYLNLKTNNGESPNSKIYNYNFKAETQSSERYNHHLKAQSQSSERDNYHVRAQTQCSEKDNYHLKAQIQSLQRDNYHFKAQARTLVVDPILPRPQLTGLIILRTFAFNTFLFI